MTETKQELLKRLENRIFERQRQLKSGMNIASDLSQGYLKMQLKELGWVINLLNEAKITGPGWR